MHTIPRTISIEPCRSLRPSSWERLQSVTLAPHDALLTLIALTYRTFLWGMDRLSPQYLAWISRICARRAFYRAAAEVPAYARFLAGNPKTGENAPETDKTSYITPYPIEDRCVRGRIPRSDVTIDESSGSTGVPYNWVRSLRERRETHRFISYFATYCFGSNPWITINAFSMGAWATGINMGLALERNSIVKNTGPDVSKILSTLRFLGPRCPYLILGYPPFLKQLIDVAEKEGFPLHEYRLNALVGGEAMSEGLRDYLLRRFQKVYSGYGATDLELGIAGETPVSVAIRRLARENLDVRSRLFGSDSRLPMVFQYNPLVHYVEVNDNRELIVTITRPSLLSPRIRYNVHDEGGILRYDEMAAALAAEGQDIERLVTGTAPRNMRLPFLWIYGRRDFTMSVMGANIYPEDVEQCLYADPELARTTRSFCQCLSETPDGGVRPCFVFEVDAEPTDTLRQQFAASILKRLLALNADFRAAWQEFPETLLPRIDLHRLGEGPFTVVAGQIKQVRLLKRNGGP
jgi:phenylacetate-CoA ligase